MILIPILFAVLFALALIGPISNLGALPAFYEALGIGEAVPWPLLVIAVALPPVLYVVGLLLGRGRPPFAQALILTVALATSFALYFGIVSLVAAFRPAIPL